MPATRRGFSSALMACAVALGGCGGIPPEPDADFSGAQRVSATAGRLIGRDRDFAVVEVRSEDSLASLAKNYLGDARRAWWIGEFNNVSQARLGQELVIPLKPRNPIGVYPQGYQTVPILCYHRFAGHPGKLAVSAASFAEQMEYLAKNRYRVVTLEDLQGFVQGRQPLPRRSVVITIDDGYRSTYETAFPILKKFGFPATVFLYSDFVGAADALSWAQMQEMTRSGLIKIQPHSKTHSDLVLRLPQETEAQYRERIHKEVDAPSAVIESRLGSKARTFAYPYGDTNEVVVDELTQRDIALGLTVTPGGNGFFANPYMMRRTMVFGEDDIDAFASKLAVFSRSAAH